MGITYKKYNTGAELTMETAYDQYQIAFKNLRYNSPTKPKGLWHDVHVYVFNEEDHDKACGESGIAMLGSFLNGANKKELHENFLSQIKEGSASAPFDNLILLTTDKDNKLANAYYAIMCEDNKLHVSGCVIMPNLTGSTAGVVMEYFVSKLLTSLQEKEIILGTKNVNLKSKKGRENVVPVTIVSNERRISEDRAVAGEGVDWKHSWEVIGHWRKCSSVGKDRQGAYNQFGRTWVNPCVKGQGDLIKKIRVVQPRHKNTSEFEHVHI